jgi:hypothetical protein
LPRFPGNTVVEQLDNGMLQAAKALRKHVPDFKFDVAKAEADIRYVAAWAERNEADLSASMQSPEANLPDVLALKLTPDASRRYLLAIFTTAAAGLGPWRGGAVGWAADEQLSLGGRRIDRQWAMDDATYRLQVFGSIVKLEQEGKLKDFFEGEPQPLGMFGAGPSVGLIVLIVLIAAVLAAAVVYYLYLGKQLQLNNKLMRDLCAEAQRRGDTETVRECIAALKPPEPWQAVATTIGIIGVAFVAIRYGLPKLLEATSKGGGRA